MWTQISLLLLEEVLPLEPSPKSFNLRSFQTVFYIGYKAKSMLFSLHPPQQCARILFVPDALFNTCILCFFENSCSKRVKLTFIVAIFAFPWWEVYWVFSTFFCKTCTSLGPFPHLELGYLSSCCLSSLYILDIIKLKKIVFHFISYIFILLIYSFAMK